MPRKLPIGISDFKKVVQEYHYIDKSLLIRDILEASPEVLLITRPRRFGKTLNMTMLRYFFEKSETNHRELFTELAIGKLPEYMERQGRYPVIYLTFKEIKKQSFQECFEKLRRVLAQEFERLAPFFKDILNEKEQGQYDRIQNETANEGEVTESLGRLTAWLYRATGERVVLLVDEYDTPIHAAHTYDYYEKGVALFRDLLGDALKDNLYVEKGVLTGIMRVARESFFSGLNNLAVYTILRSDFSSAFGFTTSEIKKLFKDFDRTLEQMEEASKWYNGYRFGDVTIYNPWSILNYLDSPNDGFIPHWVNTSSNEIIRDLIIQGSPELHKDLEILLNGGTLEVKLDDHVSFRELDGNENAVWSLLVHSGYLKPNRRRREGNHWLYELAIPNEEVHSFYEESISNWLQRSMNNNRLRQMLTALIEGDVQLFGRHLKEMILNVLSYHDVGGEAPERVYHAFVLGLLVNLGGRYRVESNRESGLGRYDVMLIPNDVSEPGILLEFKAYNQEYDGSEDAALDDALKQIVDKDYAARLREAGCGNILGVGILFSGKQVRVESRGLG